MVLLAGAAGCGEVPEPKDPPELDRQTFRSEVEPILTRRCANPSSCHGARGRPFFLYARRAARLRPADVYRDPPLTDEEHRANYHQARSFAVERGGGCELLTKPLAVGSGGSPHRGDAVFETRQNREYRAIADWVHGADGS